MKFIKILVLALVAFVSAFSVNAQEDPRRTYSGVGTNYSTTLNYFVAPIGDGIPGVGFVQASADTNVSVLRFYASDSPVQLTATNTVGLTNLLFCVGSTFASNDVVIFRNRTNDTYRRSQVFSSSATNLVLKDALLVIPNVGDQVFRQVSAGTYSVGSNTVTVLASPGYLYTGTKGRPLLYEVDGGAHANGLAIRVLSTSGVYIKP